MDNYDFLDNFDILSVDRKDAPSEQSYDSFSPIEAVDNHFEYVALWCLDWLSPDY